MTEPAAALDTAHAAISDMAAFLATVIAALGDDCARGQDHLKMGEIDLLSARDAVEKARWEIDLSGCAGGILVDVAGAAAPTPAQRRTSGSASSSNARVLHRHRAGRRAPEPDQAELFPPGDVILSGQLLAAH